MDSPVKLPPCSGHEYQDYDPLVREPSRAPGKDHGDAEGVFLGLGRDAGKALATQQKITHEMEKALRHNEGKAELSYILDFPRAVEALCRVMEHGHRHKYPRDNWKKGGKPDTEYYDSCLRHIYKDWDGEYFDTESGQLHVAHAIWNLMVLLEKNRKFSTEGTKCSPT